MKRKIYLLIQSFAIGDSAACDTMLLKRIYEGMGFDACIYSVQRQISSAYSGEIRSIDSLPEINDNDILIYVHKGGHSLCGKIGKLGGRKILIYHEPVRPAVSAQKRTCDIYAELRAQYLSTERMKDLFEEAVVFSEEGRKDLEAMGYNCTISQRPVMLAEDFFKRPAKTPLPQAMQGTAAKLVYWGKIIPEAHIEDIIAAYTCYRRYFNRNSRLILASDNSVSEEYCRRLKQYIQFLNTDDTEFALSVSREARSGYINNADAVICANGCGEFPEAAAEAVFAHIPVIALVSGSGRLLFGDGGEVLETDEPHIAAAVIDRTVSDKSFGKALAAAQKKEAEKHSAERTADTVREQIRKFIKRGEKQ